MKQYNKNSKNLSERITREDIFQAIQQKNWKCLLDALEQYEDDTDVVLNNAINLLLNEFLKHIKEYPTDQTDTDWLLALWAYNERKKNNTPKEKGIYYNFTEKDLKIITCQLAKRMKDSGDLKAAYDYAKKYPNEATCKKIIKEYKQKQPRKIEHSQSREILVTENNPIQNVDYTRTLIRSTQELEFYNALRKTFATYQIYPNVAINSVLDQDLLKDKLTTEENDFFFKGIVDCVVFDQQVEKFKPIYFFELDSEYHDTPEQQRKDQLKDSIFAKAGMKIIRIRKTNSNVHEEEFIQLIREKWV